MMATNAQMAEIIDLHEAPLIENIKRLSSENSELRKTLETWLDCYDTPDEWMRCRNEAKKVLGRDHT